MKPYNAVFIGRNILDILNFGQTGIIKEKRNQKYLFIPHGGAVFADKDNGGGYLCERRELYFGAAENMI